MAEINEWLTCNTVEELQQAANLGRPVDDFVCSLKFGTLPAIIEYGCARWCQPNLPTLPGAIHAGPLGQALSEVKCELGIRRDGEQKTAPRTIAAQEQEFFVLEGKDPTTHRDWQEFLIRFRQTSKHVGFSPGIAQGLAAALGEMADNAVLHSQVSVGTLVGYHGSNGAIVCCIADVGIGVLASLRESDRYKHLQTHAAALRVALQDGATRDATGGGYGFRSVFKALAERWGTLRFRSGEGCISMDGTGCDANRGEQMHVLARPGFQVTICCRTSELAGPSHLI